MNASRPGGEARRDAGGGRPRRAPDRQPDLSVPGHPEVLAVGDMVIVRGPTAWRRLPGVAPVAMQQGRYAAPWSRDRSPARARGRSTTATRATSPRSAGPGGGRHQGREAQRLPGVGDVALVHLWYLIGFQNRLLVFIRWAVSFLTHGRGARLIAHD